MSTCTEVVHQRRQGFYPPCLAAASWPYLVMQDEAALCRSRLVVSTFTHESKEKWEQSQSQTNTGGANESGSNSRCVGVKGGGGVAGVDVGRRMGQLLSSPSSFGSLRNEGEGSGP